MSATASHPPVVVVVGTTATGKSALGVELAERLPGGGEVINADALQVYRGFEIGTGQPTVAERRDVPHHLFGFFSPEERFSAGAFARRAHEVVAEVRARGRRPVVVGGSGLYLRALLEGISPVPPGDPAVRAALRARLEEEGLAVLFYELSERDPATAARLAPGDTQRILRALEVVEATGRPLSEWIAVRPYGEDRLEATRIGLTLPRSLLYDAIERRVARMLEQGWVGEVRDHLSRGLSPEAPAFQAIGYRELARHVAGEWSLDRAVEEIVRATRRYGKRQSTWFRKEPGVVWIDAREAARRPAYAVELC